MKKIKRKFKWFSPKMRYAPDILLRYAQNLRFAKRFECIAQHISLYIYNIMSLCIICKWHSAIFLTQCDQHGIGAQRKLWNAWQGSPYFYKWFIRFLYILKVTFEKVLNELKYLIVFCKVKILEEALCHFLSLL